MTTGLGPLSTLYAVAGTYSFTAPAGRTMVLVTMSGGGSSGNGPQVPPFGAGGGGGGSGEFCVRIPYHVTDGVATTVVVGAGGAIRGGVNTLGNAGGDSTFGTLRCKGAAQPAFATQTAIEGNQGGGPNPAGIDGTKGVIGLTEGRWWSGSNGGPHSSVSDQTRVGGPAAGRLGAAVSPSSDRGGGPGSASLWADGVTGADAGATGATGSRGAGGGGNGGGVGGPFSGAGGDGYVLIEYA